MEKYGIGVAAVAFGLFLGMGVKQAGQKSIETEKIVLRSATGSIELTAEGGPAIRMLHSDGKVAAELRVGEKETALVLNDSTGRNRMEVAGGDAPAVYMRNTQNEIVGAMLMLQDGGGAIGLADNDGDVAALVRGGSTPNVGLFQKASEPSIALGINKSVPHMLVTSNQGKDSVVMHGGDTSSLLFVDHEGEVSIFLSKHGLYQGKKQQDQEKQKKSESKVFTWQDVEKPLTDFKLAPR